MKVLEKEKHDFQQVAPIKDSGCTKADTKHMWRLVFSDLPVAVRVERGPSKGRFCFVEFPRELAFRNALWCFPWARESPSAESIGWERCLSVSPFNLSAVTLNTLSPVLTESSCNHWKSYLISLVSYWRFSSLPRLCDVQVGNQKKIRDLLAKATNW